MKEGFSSQPPNRTGYYWVRYDFGAPWQTVEVVRGSRNDSEFIAWACGVSEHFELEEFKHWGARIEEPNP